MTRTKTFTVVVVLCFLAAGLVILKFRPNSSGMRITTIGALLPLTGDSAPYGAALKKGMDLAIEEINKKGGVAGHSLALVYEDDRNLPQEGVSAFTKLTSAHRVPLVIGAMFSAVTLAIAPVAERQHVVLLSPTSSAISLTDAGDYVFRIYPSDSYDGDFLARAAYDRLGGRKVSIVALQATSTTSISELFKSVFRSKGGTIALEESYKEGATDFRAILEKVKGTQQDLVFLPGALKEMALLLRQVKELGVETQFLSISTFYDPKVLELAGIAAEGVIFSCPEFDPKSDLPSIKSFVLAYRAKYNAEPDILGAYGYDSVRIAATALAGAGRASDVAPNDIKQALYNIRDYPGVTGQMSFDANGDVTKELQLMTVQNGAFTPYTK